MASFSQTFLFSFAYRSYTVLLLLLSDYGTQLLHSMIMAAKICLYQFWWRDTALANAHITHTHITRTHVNGVNKNE